MASKLGCYNGALLHLGERRLVSVSEACDSRRALDDAWDDVVAYCLQRGFWNFAMRTGEFQYSASVAPTFGYQYAFTKPDDWVQTYKVSESERLDPPSLQFVDEAGYWYADASPLYIKYVSDDVAYGMNMSAWGAAFTEYVKARLAARTCKRITGNQDHVEELHKLEKRELATARSLDAMGEPPGFPPRGTWTTSRRAGRSVGSLWNGTTST